jgi:hypothetical protein
MTSVEQLIQASCQTAAEDLGVAITSPFVVVDAEGKAHTFLALFKDFGSGKGTLICLADDWLALNPVAVKQGYYCSGLHPASYGRYDRSLWLETFEEWGWRGPKSGRPSWCRG